jgi:hypothetical protein
MLRHGGGSSVGFVTPCVPHAGWRSRRSIFLENQQVLGHPQDETGKLFGTGITYGSQTYYMKEHDVLYSQGSFGQQGFSDMKTGLAVIFMQDWAVNAEMDKLIASRDKALAIIQYLRAQTHPDFSR